MAELAPRRLRTLDMTSPTEPDGEPWVSAASGMVLAGDSLYIVADDELHLARFAATGAAPGQWLRLFPGELPAKKKPRKKAKPDTECIALLPPSGEAPGGTLLALGSGSGPARRRAALLPLDAAGAPLGAIRQIDISATLTALESQLPELNIEGLVARGSRVTLLHRGNKGGAPNAVVTLNLAALLSGHGAAEVAIRTVHLGHVDDVPLTLTDAEARPDGSLLFTAVAEATDDRWQDGHCLGSAIGLMDAAGELRWLERLTPALKIEGIATRQAGSELECLLVTDPDDRSEPASLYSLHIPAHGRAPRPV